MFKFLLLGKDGQVGWELQRSLAPLGEVLALNRLDQNYCGDLNDPEELTRTILIYKPHFIVNAAAYTNVDGAEINPDLALALNAQAPAAIAQAAAQIDAWLIHYSTDYVFDGSGSHSRQEGEDTCPLNAYGRTKLAGEKAISTSGCKYLIFRTSWVYSVRGENFPKKILRLAKEREKLSIINDQYGAPTSAELLADVTAHSIRRIISLRNPSLAGVYNLVSNGYTNWYDFATYLLNKKQQYLSINDNILKEIISVPSSAFPSNVIRPLNSRLCTNKIKHIFGLTLPDWQWGVDRMLSELLIEK